MLTKRYAQREIASKLRGVLPQTDIDNINASLNSSDCEFIDNDVEITSDPAKFEEQILLVDQEVYDCSGIKFPTLVTKVLYEGFILYGLDLIFGQKFVEIQKYEAMTDGPHKEVEKVDGVFDVTKVYVVLVNIHVENNRRNLPKSRIYIYVPA